MQVRDFLIPTKENFEKGKINLQNPC